MAVMIITTYNRYGLKEAFHVVFHIFPACSIFFPRVYFFSGTDHPFKMGVPRTFGGLEGWFGLFCDAAALFGSIPAALMGSVFGVPGVVFSSLFVRTWRIQRGRALRLFLTAAWQFHKPVSPPPERPAKFWKALFKGMLCSENGPREYLPRRI